MIELALLDPALGAAGRGETHNLWWIILALVVIALVMPLAYLWGGGRRSMPDDARPRRPHQV